MSLDLWQTDAHGKLKKAMFSILVHLASIYFLYKQNIKMQVYIFCNRFHEEWLFLKCGKSPLQGLWMICDYSSNTENDGQHYSEILELYDFLPITFSLALIVVEEIIQL